jgi:hypothetical protein
MVAALCLAVLLAAAAAQFHMAPEDSVCGAERDCVVITRCPRLLRLLKLVWLPHPAP